MQRSPFEATIVLFWKSPAEVLHISSSVTGVCPPSGFCHSSLAAPCLQQVRTALSLLWKQSPLVEPRTGDRTRSSVGQRGQFDSRTSEGTYGQKTETKAELSESWTFPRIWDNPPRPVRSLLSLCVCVCDCRTGRMSTDWRTGETANFYCRCSTWRKFRFSAQWVTTSSSFVSKFGQMSVGMII